MIKELFLDYFQSQSPVSLKEELQKIGPALFFWTAFLTLLQDGMQDIVILIPPVLVYYSISRHPVRLDKMYYLCPMCKKERLALVKQAYLFRVVLHMVIFSAGLILWIILFHKLPLLHISFILVGDLMFSTLVFSREITEMYSLSALILAPMIMMTNMELFAGITPRVDRIIAVCSFVFLELPLYVYHIRSVKRELMLAASYDKLYLRT